MEGRKHCRNAEPHWLSRGHELSRDTQPSGARSRKPCVSYRVRRNENEPFPPDDHVTKLRDLGRREFYPARRLDERNPHCTAGRSSAASHVLISEAVELILAMVLACAFTGFAVHLTMRSSSPAAYRRIVPAQMIGPHVAGPYTGEKVEFWDKARTAAPDQRICPTPGDNAPREG